MVLVAWGLGFALAGVGAAGSASGLADGFAADAVTRAAYRW